MESYTTQDRIDIELSKAYFNNHPDKRKRKVAPPVKSRKTGRPTRRTIAIVLAFLAGAIFATSYFLNTKTFQAIKKSLNKKSPSVQVVTKQKTSPLTSTIKETSTPIAYNPEAIPDYAKEKPKNMYPHYSFEKQTTLYDFENTDQGWEIPQWEYEKEDHSPVSLEKTTNFAATGSGSLEFKVDFPGGKWTGALIEVQQYLDLKQYDLLSVDIYIPESAPWGLRGKLILTSGETWDFIEMTRGTRLYPGEWITVYADIQENSYRDWKKKTIDNSIKTDIRKIAVRVESEKAPYKGPVYIDNVKASILKKEN